MAMNGHFALNSVLRRYMFGALKPGFRSLATLKLECCRWTLNRKVQLWHRAVSFYSATVFLSLAWWVSDD